MALSLQVFAAAHSRRMADQSRSSAPTLTMTAAACRARCAASICGGAVSPPRPSGPSRPWRIVALLQARFITCQPFDRARSSAYDSLLRPQSLSSWDASLTQGSPSPAAVESPITTTRTPGGTGTRLPVSVKTGALPTSWDSELTWRSVPGAV